MATFTGTEDNDTLIGEGEDDLLEGLGGDDALDGGAGVDTLDGGGGDDLITVGETLREIGGIETLINDVVVEQANGGIDTIVWTGTGRYELGLNVEHAIAGHADGVEIAGNDLDNDIAGSDGGFGENSLEGGEGADTLRGGSWDDSLQGGAGDDLLLGQSGGDEFTVTIDRLDGGTGDDTMIGGQRYDTYWADSLGDVVVEAPTPADLEPTMDFESADRVYWAGEGVYFQPLNVEYLHLRGGATEALGNGQANTLTSDYGDFDDEGNEIGDLSVTIDGAGGDDLINGGAGLDSLLGGEGDDYVYAGDSGDTAAGGAGDDYLLGDNFMNFYDFGDDLLLGEGGNDILDGNIDDDTLDGGDGVDVLIGGAGNDMLNGGAGADRFAGGPNEDVALDYVDGEDFILGEFERVTISQDGADTLIFFPAQFDEEDGTLRLIGVDATTITAEDFQEFFQGSIDDDFLEGVDGADFLAGGGGDDDIEAGGGDDASDGGAGDDRILGGGGQDEIGGGAGSDTIDGGVEGDRMAGGAGDDLYIVDSAADRVREARVGGLDRVEASVSYTLGRGVEQLALVSPGAPDAALDGSGNELANIITGSAGANALAGLDGADKLFGYGGNDSLLGGDGEDRLNGGAGADRLRGGDGADRLTGGGGADIFAFADHGERDAITDFSAAQRDRILIASDTADGFADLSIASDGAGGAIVGWSGGSIALAGVAPGSLGAGDFIFHAGNASEPALFDGRASELFGFSPSVQVFPWPLSMIA